MFAYVIGAGLSRQTQCVWQGLDNLFFAASKNAETYN